MIPTWKRVIIYLFAGALFFIAAIIANFLIIIFDLDPKMVASALLGIIIYYFCRATIEAVRETIEEEKEKYKDEDI